MRPPVRVLPPCRHPVSSLYGDIITVPAAIPLHLHRTMYYDNFSTSTHRRECINSPSPLLRVHQPPPPHCTGQSQPPPSNPSSRRQHRHACASQTPSVRMSLAIYTSLRADRTHSHPSTSPAAVQAMSLFLADDSDSDSSVAASDSSKSLTRDAIVLPWWFSGKSAEYVVHLCLCCRCSSRHCLQTASCLPRLPRRVKVLLN